MEHDVAYMARTDAATGKVHTYIGVRQDLDDAVYHPAIVEAYQIPRRSGWSERMETKSPEE